MSRAIDFTYNMTHQEIADLLGVSRQTVRITEIRAIKKIKKNKILKEYWNGLVGETIGIDCAADIFDRDGIGRQG
jgi:transcriptional regulator